MLDIVRVADELGLTISSSVEPLPCATKLWPDTLRLSQCASVQCNSVILWLVVLNWKKDGWLPDVFILEWHSLSMINNVLSHHGMRGLIKYSLDRWMDIPNIEDVQEDFDKNRLEMKVLKKMFS